MHTVYRSIRQSCIIASDFTKETSFDRESVAMLSLLGWLKKSSVSSNTEMKSLRAASEAVAIVDKENVDVEKCRRKRKSGERHQYDEHPCT